VSLQQGRSYPLSVEQQIRTEAGKAESKAKKQAKKAKSAGEKKKPGRPKGSRNKNKADVTLNPELQRIQEMLQSLLNTTRNAVQRPGLASRRMCARSRTST
jgi:putative transposase